MVWYSCVIVLALCQSSSNSLLICDVHYIKHLWYCICMETMSWLLVSVSQTPRPRYTTRLPCREKRTKNKPSPKCTKYKPASRMCRDDDGQRSKQVNMVKNCKHSIWYSPSSWLSILPRYFLCHVYKFAFLWRSINSVTLLECSWITWVLFTQGNKEQKCFVKVKNSLAVMVVCYWIVMVYDGIK